MAILAHKINLITMKTKIFFFLSLFIVSTILINCSKEETNTEGKKYFLNKEILDDGSYSKLFYNANNNITKMEFSGAGFSSYSEYLYDSKDHLFQKNDYSSDSTLVIKDLVVMNDDNNIEKNIWYYSDIDTITTTFEFDNNKNLSKINYYYGDLVITPKYYANTVLTYNSAGNVIKEVYTDIPSSETSEYNYEYDSKISPYYQNGLKWVYFLSSLHFYDNVGCFYYLSKNNPIKKTRTIPTPLKTTNFTYNYNSDGYPTRITEGSSVTDLEYFVK